MFGSLFLVMAGLVPAIHDFLYRQDVDARDKPGHDDKAEGGPRPDESYTSPPLAVTRRKW